MRLKVVMLLLKGNPVEAETFSCVTVFFSDIVSFTALSAASTPEQVIGFLNELYTRLDAAIEPFRVYKVETIGDAYMVAGGVPERDAGHAGQVAGMALRLAETVRRFTVRHRPDHRLQLRMGMHR